MSGVGSVRFGMASAADAVTAAFNRLDQVARQMATQLRINTASDDPASFVAASELQRDLTTLKHTPGSSPEAIIQTTAALSEVRDADYTKVATSLVAARLGARVAIFAFKARLDSERLMGSLFDMKA